MFGVISAFINLNIDFGKFKNPYVVSTAAINFWKRIYRQYA